MSQVSNFEFSYRDVALLMIRDQKITEGHWGVVFEFGVQGANVETPKGPIPSAIVGAVRIGLQRFDEPNGLTVDASTVSLEARDR